jgi:hypothetical protein
MRQCFRGGAMNQKFDSIKTGPAEEISSAGGCGDHISGDIVRLPSAS